MIVERNSGTKITIDGAEYIYFSGTNYLSLTHRPELIQAAQKAFSQFGFSSSASRITSGETELLRSLESELAAFADSESAVVVPAGFMANAMVVEAVEDLVDYWIVEKSAHGSIKSAVKASGKPIIVDDGVMAPLREKHSLPSNARLGIFCEPVEPMSGGLANVSGYRGLMSDFDILILDECHSMGVLGDNGKGAVEHFDLGSLDCLIRTGTFSKAFGTYGGFILASKKLADRLLQVNAYKGSTSLSPVLIGATCTALHLIQSDKASTIGRLKENISFVSEQLNKLKLSDDKHHYTPIFSLKSSFATGSLQSLLRSERIFVPSSTGYFTDSCQIGLRWTVQSAHTTKDLEKLLSTIEAGVKQSEAV